MQFLKEHTLAIFVVIVIAIIILFFGANHFTSRKTVKVAPDVTLESIKPMITQDKNCPGAMPKLEVLVSKNPQFADALHWIGVCQFQSGQMAEAKATFEKVLSLNPEDEAAQNYLNIIAKTNASAPVSFEGQDTLTQKQFESALGLTLDPTKFSFVQVAVLPGGGQSVAAFYKTVLSMSAAQEYFISAFKKMSVDMTVKTNGGRVTLSSAVSGGTAYSATLEKNSSGVFATVMFTKTQ